MSRAQELSPASQPAEAFPNAFSFSGRHLLALLAGYFILQVIIRVTCSTSVDLDESEAVVLAQKFSWGYGSNPPLYTWLQIPFFAVFGESVLGLSILKNLLLFSTYALTFLTARLVTRWEAAAVAAALSLFYLPQVVWESQRDLTHSVLSSACAIGTLFCFLQMLATRRVLWYVALGTCAGLGMLSKYNYVLWIAGLLLAGFSMESFRPALLKWELLLTIVIALLIFLPNGLWIIENRELAFRTASKFEVKESISWLQAGRIGLKNVLQSIVSFASPLAVVYVLFFVKRPSRPVPVPEPVQAYSTLLIRAWLLIGIVLICGIVFARATGLKQRWFQPILISLPVLAISLVQARLTPFRFKTMLALSLIMMVGVAIMMPGRLFAAERLKREEPLTRPYAKLARELQPQIPAHSIVVCDTRLLAGNMRLGLPQAVVISSDLWPLFQQSYAHCFIFWDARRDQRLPGDLKSWAENNHLSLSPGTARYYSALYAHHQTKQFQLGVLSVY